MATQNLNQRDYVLQNSAYRSKNTLVTVTADAGAFLTAKNGGATSPDNIVLTATPNNVYTSSAVYTWHYALSATPTTWVLLGTGTIRTITKAALLAVIGSSTQVQYRCTVTENLLDTSYGFFTVLYSKEPSEPIVVDISRTNAVIPCSSDGTPTGYTNTDTAISVSRGGVSLAYNASGGVANSFTVSIQADNTARTVVDPVVTTTNTYGISGITDITVDTATVVFVVTVYDASGVITSPTFAKKITYTKVKNGTVGGDATFYYIEASSPVITKSTSSYLIDGTHSTITIKGKKVVGSATPVDFGYVTFTANAAGDVIAATEAVTAVSSLSPSINNNAGRISYTVKLYNQETVSGASLLDTDIIPVVFTGSSAITVALTNDSSDLPTSNDGTSTIVYTGTGTEVHVYEGATELTYDGAGTNAGTWKIATTDKSNIDIGTITDSGKHATIGVASAMAGDTASIKYNIEGTSAGKISFALSKTQTFGKTKAGIKGDQGNPGQRSVTISAYKWIEAGTAIEDFTASVTYTWADKSVAGYPAGWVANATAPNATAIGLRLYQLSLLVTDLTGVALTNTLNWSAATTNTIGYRLDGSIGPQGNSARVAYTITTINTPPIAPGSGVGDNAVPIGRSTTTTPADPNYVVAPTWDLSATSTLSPGQYMYQCDGILVTGGNITWGNPYLSNLKVGSLDAISANLGVITAGTLNAGTVFAGALSAATGTFSGALSAASGTFTGALSAATGSFSGALTANAIDAVTTINLAGQSVTIPTSSASSANTSVLTHSYTSSGNPVMLQFSATFQPGWRSTGGQNPQNYSDPVTITIKRGTTVLYTYIDNNNTGAGSFDEFAIQYPSSNRTFVYPYLDIPATGLVSYSITVTGTGVYPIIVLYKIITALEVKR